MLCYIIKHLYPINIYMYMQLHAMFTVPSVWFPLEAFDGIFLTLRTHGLQTLLLGGKSH